MPGTVVRLRLPGPKEDAGRVAGHCSHRLWLQHSRVPGHTDAEFWKHGASLLTATEGCPVRERPGGTGRLVDQFSWGWHSEPPGKSGGAATEHPDGTRNARAPRWFSGSVTARSTGVSGLGALANTSELEVADTPVAPRVYVMS
jgi:hypothetical protein